MLGETLGLMLGLKDGERDGEKLGEILTDGLTLGEIEGLVETPGISVVTHAGSPSALKAPSFPKEEESSKTVPVPPSAVIG
jgi:hypothetical protein